MIHFYPMLTRLLAGPLLAWLWWRGRREPGYRLRWLERMGWGEVSPSHMGAVWLHAASVGEVQAAQALIERLLASGPDHGLVVSTHTPTGYQALKTRWGNRVHHVYAPLDTPGATKRWLLRWQPRALVLVERELWPNWLATCRAHAVPVCLVNARLSERTAQAYARRKVLMQPVWAQLATVVAADANTAQRLSELGVPAHRLSVSGNLKMDVVPPIIQETNAWPGRRAVVLGSSHEGDEAVVLANWAERWAKHPEQLLVLVPRHPQRFEAVSNKLEALGLYFERVSQGLRHDPQTQVVLVDAMGELNQWLSWAEVALVGGTWAPVGGHNPLEPLALGRPVVFGPHTANAASLFDDIKEQVFGQRCLDAQSVWAAVDHWMSQPQAWADASQAALDWLAKQRGAAERTWAALAPVLKLVCPAPAVIPCIEGGRTEWLTAGVGKSDWLGEAWQARSGRGALHTSQWSERRVLLRHYWRGGLLGRWVKDTFWACSPHTSRAMQEFALLRLMRSWGLRVPEPMGAQVHQHGCWQRCDIAVAWIAGSRNLVQQLNEAPLSDGAWAQVGLAVRQLHDHQVHHSDLNAHNIMIDDAGQVWLVDFDKCERRAGEDWKAENLARLLRSLRKEQARQPRLQWCEENWKAFLSGYSVD
jgi:3-deoxy-D-manno-octulosonic-acid transferase